VKNLWNKLTKQQRYALLVRAYPARSWELHNLEAKLKWDKLLPSTQQEIEKLAAIPLNKWREGQARKEQDKCSQ
jgi:hypothetical protein